MNSIPNAELIRAVLDGKTVQRRCLDGWYDMPATAGTVADLAAWSEHVPTLRIKPEPFVRWLPVLKMPGGSTVLVSGRISKKDASNPYNFPRGEWNQNDKLVGVLRIELDPDTLDVVKAETEKVE